MRTKDREGRREKERQRWREKEREIERENDGVSVVFWVFSFFETLFTVSIRF